MMRTIDITHILSPDLKSRVRAHDLKVFIDNTQEDAVTLDFQNVKFATRSFIDEFYNLFLKSPNTNSFQVEITNVPEDINTILQAVSRTQTHVKVIPSKIPEYSFKDVKDFLHFLSSITL